MKFERFVMKLENEYIKHAPYKQFIKIKYLVNAAIKNCHSRILLDYIKTNLMNVLFDYLNSEGVQPGRLVRVVVNGRSSIQELLLVINQIEQELLRKWHSDFENKRELEVYAHREYDLNRKNLLKIYGKKNNKYRRNISYIKSNTRAGFYVRDNGKKHRNKLK